MGFEMITILDIMSLINNMITKNLEELLTVKLNYTKFN